MIVGASPPPVVKHLLPPPVSLPADPESYDFVFTVRDKNGTIHFVSFDQFQRSLRTCQMVRITLADNPDGSTLIIATCNTTP